MFAAQRNDGDVAHTPSDPLHINHVDDAKWANMLVIAPASADIIAKIACGIADDQLTSTVLAYSEGPKILCPAMNVHMYENAVTQRNLNTCRELGWTIVEPGSGMLACQDVGKGRMEEPAAIEAAVADLLRANQPAETLPLHGLHVLVTAGPTQEPLDPVRYLTNHSTGKMGYAIAEQARDMGADVTLVSGPVTLSAPRGIDTVHVTTAQQMFNAVQEHFTQADLTIMAAAVGDFRPVEQAQEKIKKNGRISICSSHRSPIFSRGQASIRPPTRPCAVSPWKRRILNRTQRKNSHPSIVPCWWPTISTLPAPDSRWIRMW